MAQCGAPGAWGISVLLGGEQGACFSLLATGTRWQDGPGTWMAEEHLYPPPKRGALMGIRVTTKGEAKHIPGPDCAMCCSTGIHLRCESRWQGSGETKAQAGRLLYPESKWRRKAPNSRGRRQDTEPSAPAQWRTSNPSLHQLLEPQEERVGVGEEIGDLRYMH